MPLSSRRSSRLRQFIDGSNLDIAGAGDPVEFSVVVSGRRRDHIARGSLFTGIRKRNFVGPVHSRLRGHRSIIRILGRLQPLLRQR